MSIIINPSALDMIFIGATTGFLNIIALFEAIINTTAYAITIPAMAPPDKQLELYILDYFLLHYQSFHY